MDVSNGGDSDAEIVATSPAKKYRSSDFMRKEIALFHQARRQLRAIRRYGDNDAPIPAVAPVRAVREIRPVRGSSGSIDVDA